MRPTESGDLPPPTSDPVSGPEEATGESMGRPASVAVETGASGTTGMSVMRGGIWNGVSLTLPQLWSLVISVAAARFLGPDGMGRQSFIAFVEVSVTMVFTGGIPLALMRYTSEALGRQRPEVARDLVRLAWRIELAAAAAGGAVLATVAVLRADLRSAWVLAAVAAVLGTLHTVPSAVLRGLQRWREASLVGMVTGTVGALATIAVLAGGGGITGMFAVEVIVAFANLVWTSWLARRGLPVAERLVSGDDGTRRRFFGYAGLSSAEVLLTLVVWRRSEFFFLERYSTNAQIALYSVAFSTVVAAARLLESVAAVLSPAFATLLGAGDLDRVRSGFGRALRLLTTLTLPVTAGLLAVGPTLLMVVYGADYEGTGPILVVMVLTFPLLPLVAVSHALLIGLARLRLPLFAAVAAAVVNVVLDFAVIPRFGAVGAAVANGAAQLVAGVPVLIYAWRSAGGSHWSIDGVLRAVLAGAAAGVGGVIPMAILGGLPGILMGVALGMVAYIAAAAALRILSPEDAAWLQDTMGHHLRGGVGRLCGWLSAGRV